MSAATPSTTTTFEPDLRALEQFIYREIRLIDEQRWDEWNALFTEQGEYWAPAAPGQADAQNHVSLIYETALLRAVRLRRYQHPNAFSLQPKPRCVHFVSNIMLDEFDAASGDCTLNSRFIMLQYQRDEQSVFGGVYTHMLKLIDGEYRIALKKAELINSDAALSNIQFYL